MARTLYGLSSGEIIVSVGVDGDLEPGSASLTAWTEFSGGTQHTDLTNLEGSPIAAVTPVDDGRAIFYGLDGYDGDYYLDDGINPRWLVRPVDLTERASSSGGTGTVTTVNGVSPSSGNVTLTPDNFSDATTNKVYTATEKTKLAGIATAATKNSLITEMPASVLMFKYVAAGTATTRPSSETGRMCFWFFEDGADVPQARVTSGTSGPHGIDFVAVKVPA